MHAWAIGVRRVYIHVELHRSGVMVWEGQTKDSFIFHLPDVTLVNLYGIDYTPYL